MRLGSFVLSVSVASGAAVCCAPGVARAQSQTTAIAEGLFREGRLLMDHGKIDEACDKFDASQRMSPAVGTQLNLAICREKQGRTATAWSLFAEVESVSLRAGDDVRAGVAHEHGTALAGQLKKVVIEVPTPPAGMVIKLDGIALPPGALGTEIPLDPGSHTLVATAPGKKKWEQANLALGPSATTVHVRVELENEAAAPAPAPTVPASAPAATKPSEPTPTAAAPAGELDAASAPDYNEGRANDTKRIVGIALGGVGLVALGFATYYGVTALSRKNDEANYPAGSVDRHTVYQQASDAQTAELVVGAAGLVCVGAAAYLVLTSLPSGSGPAPAAAGRVHVLPSVGAGGGGLTLTGAF
jgi:hypothetical protein